MSRLEKALENALNRRGRLDEGTRHRAVQSPVKPVRLEPPETSSPVELPPSVSPTPEATTVFPDTAPAIDRKRLSPFVHAVLEKDSPYAEAYRKIRTNIPTRAPEGAAGTYLVTSSTAAEGKSLTALNLSLMLAQGVDQTVLLVDADLRKPSIHRYLGLDAGRGLSEYLKDPRLRLADVLLHTGLGRLVVLPAGSRVDNPSELLSSNRMNDLISELRSRYRDRLVLFDSAPLLAAAETASMASWMDGIVFVVREGVTPLKIVRAGFELLRECRVVGTVVNASAAYGATAGYGGYESYSYGATRSDDRNKT